MKRNYTGDGAMFYDAVKKSGINNFDIQENMGISNGKFYMLYREVEFSEQDKKAAAKALNKRVEEIFRNATGNKSITIEDLAPNKAENSKEKNSKKLSTDKDNLLASQLTINEDDMHTINLEMVRHIMKMNEELIQTNGVLARKIPDLKEDEVERKPLKERRA